MSFVFYATTINVIIELKKLLILIINGGNTRGAITSRDIRYLTPFKICTCARFKKKKRISEPERDCSFFVPFPQVLQIIKQIHKGPFNVYVISCKVKKKMDLLGIK